MKESFAIDTLEDWDAFLRLQSLEMRFYRKDVSWHCTLQHPSRQDVRLTTPSGHSSNCKEYQYDAETRNLSDAQKRKLTFDILADSKKFGTNAVWIGTQRYPVDFAQFGPGKQKAVELDL